MSGTGSVTPAGGSQTIQLLGSDARRTNDGHNLSNKPSPDAATRIAEVHALGPNKISAPPAPPLEQKVRRLERLLAATEERESHKLESTLFAKRNALSNRPTAHWVTLPALLNLDGFDRLEPRHFDTAWTWFVRTATDDIPAGALEAIRKDSGSRAFSWPSCLPGMLAYQLAGTEDGGSRRL